MASESALIIKLDASQARAGAQEFVRSTDLVTVAAKKTDRELDEVEKSFGQTGTAAKKAATDVATAESSMSLAGKAGLALKSSLLGVAAGFVGLGTVQKITGYIIDFEKAMKQIEVIGGVPKTSAAFKELESTARALGSSTQFGAGEVAGGLLELTKAGLSAADAVKTIKPALDLAVAGDISLAQASEVLLATLAQFQFSAQESTRVADVLVKQANASQSSVAGLAEGFRVVGPLANALGITFEETAALLGVLNDNAIKASDAGTGLRTVLAALLQPTADTEKALSDLGLDLADIDPRAKGLSGVFKTLGAAGLDAGNAFRLFGSYGATVGTVLAANIGKAEAYNETLKESAGASSEAAGAIGDTLGGAVKELGGAFEDLAISIGKAGLTSVLSETAGFIKSIANEVSALVDDVARLKQTAGENLGSGKAGITSAEDLVGNAFSFSAAPKSALQESGLSFEEFRAQQLAQAGFGSFTPKSPFVIPQGLNFASTSPFQSYEGVSPFGPALPPGGVAAPPSAGQPLAADLPTFYPATGKPFGPEQGAIDQLNKELDLRRELISATEQQKEVAAALAEIQLAAESQYGVGTPEAAQAVEDYRSKLEQVLRIEEAYALAVDASAEAAKKKAEEEAKVVADTLRRNQGIADAVGDPIRSGLNSAISDVINGEEIDAAAIGRKIGNDILSGIIDELITSVLVALIKKLILSLIDTQTGGLGSSIASGLGIKAASGAVVDNGNVVPYASGGYITNGPEYFPLSGGKVGLRGEAGPEAIVPLGRGPDGKLGIKGPAGGGGVTIIQNISTPDSDSFRKSRQHMLADERRARNRYGVS